MNVLKFKRAIISKTLILISVLTRWSCRPMNTQRVPQVSAEVMTLAVNTPSPLAYKLKGVNLISYDKIKTLSLLNRLLRTLYY